MQLKVPFCKQDTKYSCGAASTQMILKFFDIFFSEEELIKKLKTDEEFGVNPKEITEFFNKQGLFCYVNDQSSIEEVESFLGKGLPVMVNYLEPSNDEGHYAVVVGIANGDIILNDPWNGEKFKLTRRDFEKRWIDERGRHPRWMLVVSDEDLNLGKQFLPA